MDYTARSYPPEGGHPGDHTSHPPERVTPHHDDAVRMRIEYLEQQKGESSYMAEARELEGYPGRSLGGNVPETRFTKVTMSNEQGVKKDLDFRLSVPTTRKPRLEKALIYQFHTIDTRFDAQTTAIRAQFEKAMRKMWCFEVKTRPCTEERKIGTCCELPRSQTQQVPILPTLVREMHLSSMLGGPTPSRIR